MQTTHLDIHYEAPVVSATITIPAVQHDYCSSCILLVLSISCMYFANKIPHLMFISIIIHFTHYQHSDWPRAPCLFWGFTWFVDKHYYSVIYYPIICADYTVRSFPASRGLSRRDKLKREGRDLCRLPTSCLMKPPTKFPVETYQFPKPVSVNV